MAGARVGVARGVMVGRAVGRTGVGVMVGVTAGALLHAASAMEATRMHALARKCAQFTRKLY